MPADHAPDHNTDLNETGLPTTLARLVEGKESGNAVVEFVRDGCRELSFQSLQKQSGRLAAGLRNQAADKGKNEPVILFAPAATLKTIAASVGILRAGRVIVPIDAQMPENDLEHVIKDSGARLAFTTRELAGRLKRLNLEPKLKCYVLDDDGDGDGDAAPLSELIAKEPSEAAEVDPDDTAVIFYTSGTTGTPKGVPLSHRNILFQMKAVARSGLLRDDDRLLLPLPLHHVYPFVIGMLAPLAFGLPVILPEALTGVALARAMREGKATITIGVPRLYHAFYHGIRDKIGKNAAGRIFFATSLFFARSGQKIGLPLGTWLFHPVRQKAGPALRILASGGSPLDPDLARNLEAMGWPVAIGYGLTETAPLLTLKKPGEGSYASVGRAVPGVQLRTDPGALPSAEAEPSGAGQGWGELLAHGPNVFSGYHHLEDKNADVFTDDGWFRTGDIARIDEDGFVYLAGRISSRIALQGGENVDPVVLEEAYSKIEGIGEIGILEDAGKLAALVVPEDRFIREHGRETTEEKIRDAIREHGKNRPSYQRPAKLEFGYQPLKRTRLGKLRRGALQTTYQAVREEATGNRAVSKGPVALGNLPSEDRSLLDNPRARAIWDILCTRYPDRPVSPDAHLEIDLGIDSLEWVELSLALEKATGVAVDDKLIGQADRVRDLLTTIADIETESHGGPDPLANPEAVIEPAECRWANPRGPVRAAVFAFLYGLAKLLIQPAFRVKCHGLENLPESQYILAPNHASYLDAPILAVALGYRRARHCFWAGWTGVMFRNVFIRKISRVAQVVPVDPRRGPLSSLAFLALVIARQRPLVWFPEGRRSPDGSLKEFQAGIGLLLQRHEVPVVPVYIEGSYRALPRGSRRPRFAGIRVHFGKPLTARDLRGDGKEKKPADLAATVRKAVADLATESEKDSRS